MDGKTHTHGPYAYRWMAQYRVGMAENFPDITPPNHVLPDKGSHKYFFRLLKNLADRIQ